MRSVVRVVAVALFLLAVGAVSAEASCSCSGTECVASGLTKAAFDECSAVASDGATIRFPAGEATWTSPVAITKKFNLVGAGAGRSVITFGLGIGRTALSLGTSNSSVSGFTFTSGEVSEAFISARGSGGTGRIYLNEFINTAPANRRCIYFSGGTGVPHPTYLVDQNTFTNCRVSIVADLGSEFGEREWIADRPWGKFAHVVYVEGNTFTYTASLGNFAEVDYGGMMVVRYNTVSNARAELHGTGGFGDRSGRWMEVYGNNFSGALLNDGIWWRAGSGLGFSNTFSSDYDTPLLFDVSTDRASTSRGMPDGTKSIDGNRGAGSTYPAAGWPALDQPGYGKYFSAFDGTNHPGMTSEPIPLFLNRQSGSIAPIATTNGGGKWIANCREVQQEAASFNGTCGTGVGPVSLRPVTCQSGVYYWATDEGDWNREQAGPDGRLYKCTSTNTWTLFYTPFDYPHPLRQGQAVASPQNLRVIR
jgi:hypothetical protein